QRSVVQCLSQLQGRSLQGAHAGCADSDDAPTPCPGLLQGGAGGCRDHNMLGMHLMICETFASHGLKGACPDMQANKSMLNSLLFKGGQQSFVKMQSCSGCGYRPGLGSINSLVTLFIFCSGLVADIRGQGQFTILV